MDRGSGRWQPSCGRRSAMIAASVRRGRACRAQSARSSSRARSTTCSPSSRTSRRRAPGFRRRGGALDVATTARGRLDAPRDRADVRPSDRERRGRDGVRPTEPGNHEKDHAERPVRRGAALPTRRRGDARGRHNGHPSAWSSSDPGAARRELVRSPVDARPSQPQAHDGIGCPVDRDATDVLVGTSSVDPRLDAWCVMFQDRVRPLACGTPNATQPREELSASKRGRVATQRGTCMSPGHERPARHPLGETWGGPWRW